MSDTKAPINLLHQMTLEQPTQFWSDSCEVTSLARAIEWGATGATSNPVIVLEAIEADRPRWLEVTQKLIALHPTDTEEQLAWRLVAQAAIESAELLLPLFVASKGRRGRLCVQVNPRNWTDPQAMIAQGKSLAELGENIAIKVPAVKAGIEAIEELTAAGVVINATVLFTLPQALAVAEALERGLKRAEAAGLDAAAMTPWVTIMVGRIDDYLRDVAQTESLSIDAALIRHASTAIVRKAYRLFKSRGYRSTLLAAAMRSHHHWSEFIGGDLVVTIPPSWQERFNSSGVDVKSRIDDEVDQEIISTLRALPQFVAAYEEDGLSVDEFAHFGASKKTLHQFLEGYDKLLCFVREQMLPR